MKVTSSKNSNKRLFNQNSRNCTKNDASTKKYLRQVPSGTALPPFALSSRFTTVEAELKESREERVLQKSDRLASEWESFRQRMAKKLNRRIGDLVVTRAEDHREKIEDGVLEAGTTVLRFITDDLRAFDLRELFTSSPANETSEKKFKTSQAELNLQVYDFLQQAVPRCPPGLDQWSASLRDDDEIIINIGGLRSGLITKIRRGQGDLKEFIRRPNHCDISLSNSIPSSSLLSTSPYDSGAEIDANSRIVNIFPKSKKSLDSFTESVIDSADDFVDDDLFNNNNGQCFGSLSEEAFPMNILHSKNSISKESMVGAGALSQIQTTSKNKSFNPKHDNGAKLRDIRGRRSWKNNLYLQQKLNKWGENLKRLAPGKFAPSDNLFLRGNKILRTTSEEVILQSSEINDKKEDLEKDVTSVQNNGGYLKKDKSFPEKEGMSQHTNKGTISKEAEKDVDKNYDEHLNSLSVRDLLKGPHIRLSPTEIIFIAHVARPSLVSVILHNTGTCVLYYKWIPSLCRKTSFLNTNVSSKTSGTGEGALRRHHIICDHLNGCLLPGEKQPQQFSFLSQCAGLFEDSWHLQLTPSVNCPDIFVTETSDNSVISSTSCTFSPKLHFRAMVLEEDACSIPRAAFGNEMLRNIRWRHMKELVDSLVETVTMACPGRKRYFSSLPLDLLGTLFMDLNPMYSHRVYCTRPRLEQLGRLAAIIIHHLSSQNCSPSYFSQTQERIESLLPIPSISYLGNNLSLAPFYDRDQQQCHAPRYISFSNLFHLVESLSALSDRQRCFRMELLSLYQKFCHPPSQQEDVFYKSPQVADENSEIPAEEVAKKELQNSPRSGRCPFTRLEENPEFTSEEVLFTHNNSQNTEPFWEEARCRIRSILKLSLVNAKEEMGQHYERATKLLMSFVPGCPYFQDQLRGDSSICKDTLKISSQKMTIYDISASGKTFLIDVAVVPNEIRGLEQLCRSLYIFIKRGAVNVFVACHLPQLKVSEQLGGILSKVLENVWVPKIRKCFQEKEMDGEEHEEVLSESSLKRFWQGNVAVKFVPNGATSEDIEKRLYGKETSQRTPDMENGEKDTDEKEDEDASDDEEEDEDASDDGTDEDEGEGASDDSDIKIVRPKIFLFENFLAFLAQNATRLAARVSTPLHQQPQQELSSATATISYPSVKSDVLDDESARYDEQAAEGNINGNEEEKHDALSLDNNRDEKRYARAVEGLKINALVIDFLSADIPAIEHCRWEGHENQEDVENSTTPKKCFVDSNSASRVSLYNTIWTNPWITSERILGPHAIRELHLLAQFSGFLPLREQGTYFPWKTTRKEKRVSSIVAAEKGEEKCKTCGTGETEECDEEQEENDCFLESWKALKFFGSTIRPKNEPPRTAFRLAILRRLRQLQLDSCNSMISTSNFSCLTIFSAFYSFPLSCLHSSGTLPYFTEPKTIDLLMWAERQLRVLQYIVEDSVTTDLFVSGDIMILLLLGCIEAQQSETWNIRKLHEEENKDIYDKNSKNDGQQEEDAQTDAEQHHDGNPRQEIFLEASSVFPETDDPIVKNQKHLRGIRKTRFTVQQGLEVTRDHSVPSSSREKMPFIFFPWAGLHEKLQDGLKEAGRQIVRKAHARGIQLHFPRDVIVRSFQSQSPPSSPHIPSAVNNPTFPIPPQSDGSTVLSVRSKSAAGIPAAVMETPINEAREVPKVLKAELSKTYHCHLPPTGEIFDYLKGVAKPSSGNNTDAVADHEQQEICSDQVAEASLTPIAKEEANSDQVVDKPSTPAANEATDENLGEAAETRRNLIVNSVLLVDIGTESWTQLAELTITPMRIIPNVNRSDDLPDSVDATGGKGVPTTTALCWIGDPLGQVWQKTSSDVNVDELKDNDKPAVNDVTKRDCMMNRMESRRHRRKYRRTIDCQSSTGHLVKMWKALTYRVENDLDAATDRENNQESEDEEDSSMENDSEEESQDEDENNDSDTQDDRNDDSEEATLRDGKCNEHPYWRVEHDCETQPPALVAFIGKGISRFLDCEAFDSNFNKSKQSGRSVCVTSSTDGSITDILGGYWVPKILACDVRRDHEP